LYRAEGLFAVGTAAGTRIIVLDGIHNLPVAGGAGFDAAFAKLLWLLVFAVNAGLCSSDCSY